MELPAFDPRCCRCPSHFHWSLTSCLPRRPNPNWSCSSLIRMRSPIRCCCLSCPTSWRRTRSSCSFSAFDGPSFLPRKPLPSAPPPGSWVRQPPFGTYACLAAWYASSGGRICASPCTHSSSVRSAGTSGTGCHWESLLLALRICCYRIRRLQQKSRLGYFLNATNLFFCANLRAARPTKVILKHSSRRCWEEILMWVETNVAGWKNWEK